MIAVFGKTAGALYLCVVACLFCVFDEDIRVLTDDEASSICGGACYVTTAVGCPAPPPGANCTGGCVGGVCNSNHGAPSFTGGGNYQVAVSTSYGLDGMQPGPIHNCHSACSCGCAGIACVNSNCVGHDPRQTSFAWGADCAYAFNGSSDLMRSLALRNGLQAF